MGLRPTPEKAIIALRVNSLKQDKKKEVLKGLLLGRGDATRESAKRLK